MPNFLVDENLSPKISSHLNALGFQATHVRDTSLRGKPDFEIISWAVSHHCIVITRDLGFGQVYPLYQPNLGVILIRSKSNKTEVLVEIIDRLNLEKVLSSPKIAGSLVIATPTKTRIV